MSTAEINNSVIDLTHQDLDNDHQVDNLVMAMMEIDEQRFDKIISSSIIKHGFSYTFENLLYKFLEKIGILWQIGAVDPAQEHFISQLIRQKLIIAIDGQNETRNNAKKFLLFLPENEYHELALLYLHFLIRKEGHIVIYLGQNVPLLNLKNIFEFHKIDYLLTSIASHMPEEKITEMIVEINQLFVDKQVLIGGHCLNNLSVVLPENIKSFNTIKDFTDFLHLI